MANDLYYKKRLTTRINREMTPTNIFTHAVCPMSFLQMP